MTRWVSPLVAAVVWAVVAFDVIAVGLVAAGVLPFQPLRRSVHRAVDRRFDRARYDGHHTVDAFAEHLRNQVDLTTIRSSLASTADAAVRPSTASVWLTEGTR